MRVPPTLHPRRLFGLALVLGLLASPESSIGRERLSPPTETELVAELARAFRVDVSELTIELDFHPTEDRLDGTATLTFTMREGQTRALFHFNPQRRRSLRKERKLLTAVTLDDEVLDPQDDADVRPVRGAKGAEPAFELQRDLGAGEHTLEVSWSTPKATRSMPSDGERHQGWLYPIFDDTEGPRRKTETLWPTVSSPEELARHRITLRVHDAVDYTVIGSGRTARLDSDPTVQAWSIDTEQAVSSSSVFFAAVPAADVRRTDFEVRGVDVTIVTDRTDEVLDEAVEITQDTIARLEDDLGDFPVPNLQILLTRWSSGMEYYGATRTGLGALEHELVHMYFGTVTVNRTWRDTWFDEAVVEWWLDQDDVASLPRRYRSKLALDRPIAAPGFNGRAYGAGARILGEVADAMGGSAEMIAFLRDLHARRAFQPFSTEELIDDILGAQETLDRARLERWLYGRK